VGVLEVEGKEFVQGRWKMPQGGSNVILSNRDELVHNLALHRDWEAKGVQSSRSDQSAGPTLNLTTALTAVSVSYIYRTKLN
jgi:hypothetical protein